MMLVVAMPQLIADTTLAMLTASNPAATSANAMLICLLLICISGTKVRIIWRKLKSFLQNNH